MYARRMGMESLLNSSQYRMEMFEVNAKGVQPFVIACENQFLKTLRALKSAKLRHSFDATVTHQTSSKTVINLRYWGIPLLLALQEITKSKEQNIEVDEIKHAMGKYLSSSTEIPNSSIGYALKHLGFNNKVHTNYGNNYNIGKEEVEVILQREELKR